MPKRPKFAGPPPQPGAGARAWLFASKSDKDGSQFPSKEAQLLRLEQRCAELGWREVGRSTDEDHSGYMLRGPGFAEALDRGRAGDYDVLMMVRWDRGVRNVEEALALRRVLYGWGVSVHTIDEPADFEGPYGQAVFAILRAIDQLPSDMASYLGQIKTAHRAPAGLCIGQAPFGFRIGKVPSPKDPTLMISTGILEPHPLRLPVLLQLIAWLLESGSVSQTLYNAEAAGYKTARGGPWTWTSLEYCLRNRTMLGEIGHLGKWYKGKHEAVITETTFEQIQVVLDRNTGKAGKGDRISNTAVPLLAGRLWCAHSRLVDVAGNAVADYEELHSHPSGKLDPKGQPYRYYRLNGSRRPISGYAREILDEAPRFKSVPAGEIEELVVAAVAADAGDQGLWEEAETRLRGSCRTALRDLARAKLRLSREIECGEGELRALEAEWWSPAVDRLQPTVQRLYGERMEAQRARLAELPALLEEAEELGRWYEDLPAEVLQARELFLRVARLRGGPDRLALRDALRDVLEDPYGVLLNNSGVPLINYRLGPLLQARASKFVEIEKSLPRLDSNQ